MRQVGAVEEGQDCRDSPGRTEAHVGSDGNNKRMKVNRKKRGKGERSVRQFYKTLILTQQNSMKLQSRTPTNIQNSEIAAGLTLKPQITAVGLLFLLHYCLVSGHLERYEKPESVKFPDPPPLLFLLPTETLECISGVLGNGMSASGISNSPLRVVMKLQQERWRSVRLTTSDHKSHSINPLIPSSSSSSSSSLSFQAPLQSISTLFSFSPLSIIGLDYILSPLLHSSCLSSSTLLLPTVPRTLT